MTPTKTWTTRKGEVIPISKMTDSHLVNTIKFLRRKMAFERPLVLRELLSASCTIVGEMASMECDREIERWECDSDDELLEATVPQWEELIEEAVRRKLSVVEGD